ncbi:MAG: MEKHLA domain-containing protein [Chthoniobacterales bacterium]|jgi:PAS domain-containing protein
MNLPAQLEAPSRLVLANYRRLLGRDLAGIAEGPGAAEQLFAAPCVVLSALGPFGSDHVFNYANRAALDLFEYSWDELMGKPSSASAEPVHRDERRRLLDEVGRRGFIENYSGIRIGKSGRRFRIKQATVFNLLDDKDRYLGQAATFADYEYL